jgi:transcriptional regulator with XRE-family HTH domain
MKPETLALVRTSEGMSRAAIAKRLQLNRDTWSDYEAGKRPVPTWLSLAVTCIYRRMEPLE